MDLPHDLEAAIRDAPDDRTAYSVAADWLQQAGAAHGELVALSLVDNTEAIADRIIELKQRLLPSEVHTLNPMSFEWRWGFVRGVYIASIKAPDEPRTLSELLASPAARFVQKLVLAQASPRLVDAVHDAAAREPRALQCVRTLMLFLDDVPSHPLDLARLSVTLPALRRLVIRVRHTTGALAMPHLFELTLDGNLETSRVLASSLLPALERLVISGAFDRDAPDDWLDPERVPALRALTFTGEGTLIDRRIWLQARIERQLLQLDLFDVTRGQPTERSFVIDRQAGSTTCGLLAVVGRGKLKPGTYVAVDGEPFRIGRGARSQLRLDTSEVGMVHAEIHRHRDRWWIRSAAEDRVVYINGHYISDAVQLRCDDELAIGDHVFRFIEGPELGEVAARMRDRFAL